MDLFLFMGDNIYGDTTNMTVMRGKYDALKNSRFFQGLKKKAPIWKEELTESGTQRFTELVADTGPQNYTDDGFGVHLAFFNRTPAEARMRILEGRRRQVEERREGLREAIARASSSFDRYTKQLHQLGLESSEREVKWLNELIAAERVAQGRPESQP